MKDFNEDINFDFNLEGMEEDILSDYLGVVADLIVKVRFYIESNPEGELLNSLPVDQVETVFAFFNIVKEMLLKWELQELYDDVIWIEENIVSKKNQ